MNDSPAFPTFDGKRVLVVEDTTIVAHEIQLILSKMKCIVLGPVAQVDDAIELIRKVPVDGVILDIDLHGTPSYPVADELCQRSIPFLFTSGYGIGSMPEQYQQYPRLEKPFGIKDLQTKLQLLLTSGTRNQ